MPDPEATPIILGPDGQPMLPPGVGDPMALLLQLVDSMRRMRHSADMTYCMTVVKMPSPWKRDHPEMVKNATAVLDDAEAAATEFNEVLDAAGADGGADELAARRPTTDLEEAGRG